MDVLKSPVVIKKENRFSEAVQNFDVFFSIFLSQNPQIIYNFD